MATTITPDPNLAPRLEFRSLEAYDKRQAETLYEERVGFPIANALDLVCDDEEAVHGIAITEVERIVAFGIAMVLTEEGVEDYFDADATRTPSGASNLVLHAGVVAEDWEGRGLGSELMRLRLELCRDAYEPDVALGNAWLRPHTVDSSALFEKHGFERVTTVENAFRRRGTERDCPDCSPEPCACRSAVYAKSLDG